MPGEPSTRLPQTGVSQGLPSPSSTCCPTPLPVWTPSFTASWTSASAWPSWPPSPAVPSRSPPPYGEMLGRKRRGKRRELPSPNVLTHTCLHLHPPELHQGRRGAVNCLVLESDCGISWMQFSSESMKRFSWQQTQRELWGKSMLSLSECYITFPSKVQRRKRALKIKDFMKSLRGCSVCINSTAKIGVLYNNSFA